MMCARSSFLPAACAGLAAGTTLPTPIIAVITNATHATLRCARLMEASCRRATLARSPGVVKARRRLTRAAACPYDPRRRDPAPARHPVAAARRDDGADDR